MKQVKKNKRFLFLLLISALIFFSCGDEPQIEREKLVKIFVDITVAQSKYANFPDSLDLAKQAIFKKHDVTQKMYEQSIKNAEIRAEYWDKFFIEANQYLDSLKRVSNQQTTPLPKSL